jgi:hypothetical protein
MKMHVVKDLRSAQEAIEAIVIESEGFTGRLRGLPLRPLPEDSRGVTRRTAEGPTFRACSPGHAQPADEEAQRR